jgi:hypothetical protein
VTEIAIPDDPRLAGFNFQIRAALRDSLTGKLRWSDEIEVVLSRASVATR